MRNRIFPRSIKTYRSDSDEELEHYENYFEKRKMDNFAFLRTPYFPKLTKRILSAVPFKIHTWKFGDKFYKLSYENYGSTTNWWIIPWFNRTPTESHLEIGDQIYIPTDINLLFSYI
jgi:hypothetical protein